MGNNQHRGYDRDDHEYERRPRHDERRDREPGRGNSHRKQDARRRRINPSAGRIREFLRRANARGYDALYYLSRVGGILCTVKEETIYGDFGRRCEKEFGLSRESVSRYKRLKKGWYTFCERLEVLQDIEGHKDYHYTLKFALDLIDGTYVAAPAGSAPADLNSRATDKKPSTRGVRSRARSEKATVRDDRPAEGPPEDSEHASQAKPAETVAVQTDPEQPELPLQHLMLSDIDRRVQAAFAQKLSSTDRMTLENALEQLIRGSNRPQNSRTLVQLARNRLTTVQALLELAGRTSLSTQVDFLNGLNAACDAEFGSA